MNSEKADLIRKIADIVDLEPERFDMSWFEQTGGCDSAACIAGHIGELTGDRFASRENFDSWYERQAKNIGLDPWAGDYLFAGYRIMQMENAAISRLLRKLAKEVAALEPGELVSEDEIGWLVDEIVCEDAASVAERTV